MQASSDSSWIQSVGHIHLAPILHGRVEFSRYVREAVRELSPDIVAIELPRGMEDIYRRAVSRLPRLSYITAARLDQAEGVPLWKIEPTDPYCEAVRTALELEIPVHFVDELEAGYPVGGDLLPDPYTVLGLGPGRYYQACRDSLLSRNSDDPRQRFDSRRELNMAARLQNLARRGRVLFVAGMKHIAPLTELLATPQQLQELPQRLPEFEIYHPTLRTVRTLADETPFLMTLYELQRGGIGSEDVWRSSTLEPDNKESDSGTSQAPKLSRDAVFGSLEQLLGIRVTPEEEKQMSPEQLKRFVAYLKSLNPETWTPPSFDDEPLPEEPTETFGEERFFVYKDANQRREELLGEYQRLNGECRTADGHLDRQLVYRALVRLAGRFYEENTGETFKAWQHDNLNKFARRYAALQGRLLPGLLPMIYSARACVDHNFAYEFWDLATFYPWQENPDGSCPETSGTALFDFDGDALSINGMKLQKFEFHRTFPRLRQKLVSVPGGGREQPTGDPNDWAGAFESGRICSYPPEDIVIEDYGRYLQKKAIKVQSEAHSRTEPFTTSLLDGIDMRTTLRNWADGQKLYVREERKIDGGTGSVVLIFDEDQGKNQYPWCITWHGEHDQESDMAFYATDRKRQIIGPGIARCEYGGLMLSYPPRRLVNIWNDPYFRGAKTKAEVLLFAAIEYCLDKHVLYVAPQAPRSFFFSLAQRLGKKLVYLPIGTLSPTSLERIRVFHVLAGHRYREIAKNFIW